MLHAILAGLIALAPAPRTAPTATQDKKPTIVLAVKSIDGLLADARLLVQSLGKPGDVERMDGQLKNLPLDAIDKTKPIVAYGRLDENLADSQAVIFLPVKNLDALFRVVEQLTMQKPTKEDGGVYSYRLPNLPVPIFVKEAHGYACITAMSPQAFDTMPTPASLLGGQAPKSLSMVARLSQIPDVFKQIAIGQLELRITDMAEKKPGQSLAEHALAEQVAREAARRVTMLIRDGGEIGVSLDLDRNTWEIATNVSISGKAGTPLAADIASLATAKSLFGSWMQAGGAANAVARLALPDDVRKALGPVVDESLKKVLAQQQDAAQRELTRPLVESIAPSLKAGEVELGIALAQGGAGKLFGLVLGLKLKDGLGVEKAIKELREKVPEAQNFLKVDTDRAGGFNVHQIDLPLDDNAKKTLGENPIFAAFRDDCLLVAAGENGLSMLKKAASGTASSTPLVGVKLSMEKLAPLMRDTKADATEAARKVFISGDKGRDTVEAKLEGGQELRLKASIPLAVLKFLQAVNPQ